MKFLSTINYKLSTLLVSVIALTSCTQSIQGYIDEARETASGSIVEVKDVVQEITEPVTDAVEDANRRIEDVTEGVNKVKEGVDQLKGAVSTGE